MFLNAVMLAGIAGAALPLIVHLLSRSRVRTVDWGAMMFLDEGRGTQEHMAKLKQWTLLLLRMAIVALLAIAMARPIASANWAGPSGPATAIIIIDCSASMAEPTGNGRTRADLAREAVLRLLSTLQKGDRAALILAGAGQEVVSPTPDLQSIAARVAEVKPSPSAAADLAGALNEAASVIERSTFLNARLYLFTDAQATGWQGVDGPFEASWRRRTNRAGRSVPFDVVTVGDGREADNIAIESITIAPLPVVAGIASEVEVKLRNFGSAPRSSLPLTVRNATEVVFSKTIDLSPGSTATLTFPIHFDLPGPKTLVAEVASSGTLAFDDRLHHLLDVVAPPRVLVVSGDERGGAGGTFRSESDFLRTALAPYSTMKRAGVDLAKVTVIPVESWTDPVLSETSVLVLANVAELTPQQVRAVESFVYAGGGVLVAPGAATRADSYNRTLFRDGTGFLPASLAGPSSDQPTSLLGIELAHPIFRFLRGRPAPIPTAVVARMFAATPRSGAAVLASYVTGQPFLIEGAYGRGRVLLMTTTIDADWNTLPLSSFYLPFAHSAVRYLALAALPQRNLAPGQELRARVDHVPDQMRATLTLPGGRTTALEADATGGSGYEVTYRNTREPGLYSLRAKTGGAEHLQQFFVRPELAESDLEPLDDAQWSKLQRSLAFRRTSAAARTSLAGSAQPVRELWLPVLLGALSLVAIELILTRFWSEGRQE